MEHRHQDIQVNVVSEYLPQQSSPQEQRFVFAYHVNIRNDGDAPAQLLSRRWIITDADQQVQEVTGDGVIGEQPVIQPGESFQYSSGAILRTPVGTMQGSYHMIEPASGAAFDTPIPIFRLAPPHSIN